MKHLILTLSLILGLGTSVLAQQYKRTLSNTSYFEGKEIKIGEKIICEEEASTGFHWEDGGYKSTNYKTHNYLFTKQEHRPTVQSDCTDKFEVACNCPASMRYSRETDSHNYDDNSLPSYLTRCYLVKEGSNGRVHSEECKESYIDGKLHKVSCDRGTYSFHPNQLFLRAPTEASKDISMFPKNDYKDSYIISHGSCRVMAY